MASGSVATLRFYAGLKDFLPSARQGRPFPCAFDSPASVKDLIESLGVPHPEVELVLVNGEPVSFGAHVYAGDRVSVYPHFRALDLRGVAVVAPPMPAPPRFLLDTHLGRLASYLRLAGLDTAYGHGWDDARLAETSQREARILLTRDVGLLKRSVVEHGYFVRQTNPKRQLAEVAERYDLATAARPFSRCLRCNDEIVPVSKAEVLEQLPPRTRAHFDEYWRCPGCGRVYWKGSHYERLRQVLESAL